MIRISIPAKTHYQDSSTEVVGIITKITQKENYITYEVKAKEKILVRMKQEDSFQLGDTIQVEGVFEKASSYYQNQRITYIVKGETIKRIKKNKNPLLMIKNYLRKKWKKDPYLYTFLLGDKSLLSDEVIRSYQENGISHLFAISGMHISLLAFLLQKGFKKVFTEEKRYHMISLFLIGYLCLVGFSPSIMRGVLFYIFFEGNKVYYFYIKKENLFILILSLSLLWNPNMIYDTGFQYSYFISFSLLKMSEDLASSNKILSLLKVSILSFLVSSPITLKNNNQLNLLSILYNLFFVPFVSTIVFPSSLVVGIFSFLEPLYQQLIGILEKTSLLLSNISIGKILWKSIPNDMYILYGIIILMYLCTKNKKIIVVYFLCLGIHWIFPYIEATDKMIFIDVGQGDSTLFISHQKAVLIDTGGKVGNDSLFYNTIQPILKREAISKIDTLILTHGDFDHMGESIHIVNHFKVKKVIFNCGELNDLEENLIQVLEKKKIPYDSCIDELKTNHHTLYFLQTKEYNNENDNSNVIYMEINGYQFMLMGDAGIQKEKDILDEYDISNIDVLKVGHHGSNTSSSKEFIQEMNPTYSIISVGKNNRYGHPNKEVLMILEDSQIFRTDENGSILFTMNRHHFRHKLYGNMV